MAEPDEREDQPNPEDWIRDAVHKMFQGNQGFDPEELARAAGFTGDPAQLQAMVEQFAKGISGAINNSDQSARDHAVSVAAKGATSVDPARAEALARALGTAALWLNSATDFAEPEGRPLLMSRQDWARATLPVWQEMAEPVAKALAEAIANLMKEQGPEEVRELLGSSSVLVSMTTGLFKLQLSQVVGGLAGEVLSAGDIGIPLLHASSDNDVRSGLVPQNMDAFSEGLGVPGDEVDLYLAIRELAHQRLFRHARWLRNHVLSLVGDFARGIHIDGEAIMDLAESLIPMTLTKFHASSRVVRCFLREPKRKIEHSSGWKRCWRSLRGGWTTSPNPLRTCCLIRQKSPKPSDAGVPRAGLLSTPSKHWSDWSCALADCARRQRCGLQSTNNMVPMRAMRCGHTPTTCRPKRTWISPRISSRG